MFRLSPVVVGLVVMGGLVGGCSQGGVVSEVPESTVVPAPTLTQSPSETLEPTVTATLTLTPTAVPTASPTSTPDPGRQILIQYGWFGGDGVSPDLYYLGVNAPSFVLYVSGRLVVREGELGRFSPEEEFGGEGYTYRETTLTVDDMCGLLASMADAGIFDIEEDTRDYFFDPSPSLYTFDTDDPEDMPPFGEGAPDPIIVVNGDPAQYVVVFSPWLSSLQPEIAAVYDLLDSYRPPGLTAYSPDRVLLYLGRGSSPLEGGEGSLERWPVDLPSLGELYGRAVVVDGGRHVVVEGETGQAILRLFGHRLHGKRFADGGWGYLVVARPLLPHETIDAFSVCPSGAESFVLPFDCGG